MFTGVLFAVTGMDALIQRAHGCAGAVISVVFFFYAFYFTYVFTLNLIRIKYETE